MKNKIIIILSIISLFAQVAYAQSRVNREKESFTSSTKLLDVTTEWRLNNDGTWHKSKSNTYAFNNTADHSMPRPEGFHEIDLISFNDNGQEVYAICYEIGFYSYYYENIHLDPYRYTELFYFFISSSDLSQIANLEDGELAISFSGYIDHFREGDEDGLIQEYKKKSSFSIHDAPILARLKVTEQKGNKVLRFTLPYDERQQNANVFLSGPYYEISYSKFNSIKKKINRVISK